METLDLVVVGAGRFLSCWIWGWIADPKCSTGIFGLAAAKTFKQLNPGKSLAILDSGSTLGGGLGQGPPVPRAQNQ
jgi:hypothetical protein